MRLLLLVSAATGFEVGYVAGQENRETGAGTAGAACAPDADRAANAVNDTRAQPQPQPCSLVAFRGEKRLKDPRAMLGVNAAARIGHRKAVPTMMMNFTTPGRGRI